MVIDKQKILLEYLISSPETYAICTSILKTDYFDPTLRSAVDFVGEYFNKYNSLPEPDQIEVETSTKLEHRPVTHDKISFCTDEVEKFCKQRAMEIAIKSSIELYNNDEFGKIEQLVKEAILVSLHRDMGVDFFQDPETYMNQLLEGTNVEPIGWDDFDDTLDGGICRKQMLLISANSGGGKSIVMANIGLNFVYKGYTVLLISLELPEEMIYSRYIQMVADKDSVTWKKNPQDTLNKILKAKQHTSAIDDNGDPREGSLTIKRMKNGSSANDIRGYMKEFELKNGKAPDMVIVDYVDLMAPNEKTSSDNVFKEDKEATEQLREIGEDYNAWIVTASQQNRGAVNAEVLDHTHIAGGISKINTTDVYVSVLMSDKYKAEKIMGFHFLKTRTSGGVGDVVFVGYNPSTLRLSNRKVDTSGLDTSMITSAKTDGKDGKEKPSVESMLLNMNSALDS